MIGGSKSYSADWFSQGYARRHEINRDSTWFLLKRQEESR